MRKVHALTLFFGEKRKRHERNLFRLMAALSALLYFPTLGGLLTWRWDLKHGRASRAAIIPYRKLGEFPNGLNG